MTLLEQAVEAHGGLARWRAAGEIVARIRSGGFALASRWQARAFHAYEARISTRLPRLVVTPFGGPDRRGVFERDRVAIETADGRLVTERRDPRAAFRGLRRKLWWDALDTLHFGGYAIWNYFTAPFLLLEPGVESEELPPGHEGGEERRRLRVRFPDQIPTHCREQVFHFDPAGRLRRLDYTAEVFGSWAAAVHYCDEPREFSGLLVPTRRRVYPRKADGRPRPFPTLIWIDVDDVTVLPAR